MQTSIKWLMQRHVEQNGILTAQDWRQAQEMHKQEIVDAFESGEDNIDNDGCAINKNGAEFYYNETFKKD
jgi:hypothetical protein